MEPRLILAYALIVLMIVAVAGTIAYRIHHSHQRTYHRRLRREHRLYADREPREHGEAPDAS
ncbi:hypothetical protein TPR58_20170 [Sphingomonas sp. HF-S3]|uniref:Secreted protein n=1 Tax=Sphingomonas rustica TaxID=3103142 RepID=A0ABV0BGM0_9SPHN